MATAKVPIHSCTRRTKLGGDVRDHFRKNKQYRVRIHHQQPQLMQNDRNADLYDLQAALSALEKRQPEDFIP